MRISLRLTILLLIISGGNLAFAQNENTISSETTQSAKVSLKSGNMPKANKCKKWDVALHGGIMVPNTVLTTTAFNAPNVITQI